MFLYKLLVILPAVSVLIGSLLESYFASWADLFHMYGTLTDFINDNGVWAVTNVFFVIWYIIFIVGIFLNKTASVASKPKKEDGLLMTWCKNKYCPTIDY